jgi:hypothetical protein
VRAITGWRIITATTLFLMVFLGLVLFSDSIDHLGRPQSDFLFVLAFFLFVTAASSAALIYTSSIDLAYPPFAILLYGGVLLVPVFIAGSGCLLTYENLSGPTLSALGYTVSIFAGLAQAGITLRIFGAV